MTRSPRPFFSSKISSTTSSPAQLFGGCFSWPDFHSDIRTHHFSTTSSTAACSSNNVVWLYPFSRVKIVIEANIFRVSNVNSLAPSVAAIRHCFTLLDQFFLLNRPPPSSLRPPTPCLTPLIPNYQSNNQQRPSLPIVLWAVYSCDAFSSKKKWKKNQMQFSLFMLNASYYKN